MSSEAAFLNFITAAKEKGATDEFVYRLLAANGWPAKGLGQIF